MNNPNIVNPEASKKEKLYRRGKKAFAVGSIAMVGIAGLGGVAEANQSTSKSNQHLERTSPLEVRSFNQLPGLNKKTSHEQLNHLNSHVDELKRSYLKIMRKEIGSTGAYESWCDGKKTTKGVETAGHCVSEATGEEYGSIILPQPLDFISLSGYEYAVEDPVTGNIVGEVNSIVIPGDGNDYALLGIAPMSPDKFINSGPTYDQIPAESIPETDANPIPGSPVLAYSRPVSTNFAPVLSNTGRYIGTYKMTSNGISRNMFVVVDNHKLESKDACTYGASGSSAIYSLGGKVFRTGPASIRWSTVPGNDGYEGFSLMRSDMEKKMRVQFPSNITEVCLYTKESAHTRALAATPNAPQAAQKITIQ